MKTRRKYLSAVAVIVLQLFILSCSKTDNYPKYDPPADHTVSNDGVMHKSGLQQPELNCTGCHGDNLDGGIVGVSCYECHGKTW